MKGFHHEINFRIAHRVLHTGSWVMEHYRGDNNGGKCYLCGRDRETLAHLLVECPLVKQVHHNRFSGWRSQIVPNKETILDRILNANEKTKKVFNFHLNLRNAIIWQYRNKVRSGVIQAGTASFHSYWKQVEENNRELKRYSWHHRKYKWFYYLE